MHRTQEATDQGYAAGRAGEPSESNPHAGVDATLAGYWSIGHQHGTQARRDNVLDWPTLRRGQAPQRFAA